MTELEWMDIFGDNLVYMMKEANMTQHDLAMATGLSDSIISYYVHKQRVPGIKAIINISDALGCTPADLIDFGEMID